MSQIRKDEVLRGIAPKPFSVISKSGFYASKLCPYRGSDGTPFDTQKPVVTVSIEFRIEQRTSDQSNKADNRAS